MATIDSTPLPRRVKDLRGQQFGRLTVVDFAGIHTFPRGERATKWVCLCECATHITVLAPALRSKNTQSCGCLQREQASLANKRHGMTKTKIHLRWRGMIGRCENPNHIGYKNYGGRGIYVCERWRMSFLNFLADMGYPPTSNHSIERRDNNGHYSPDNCYWATAKQQNRNSRHNHLLRYNGETLCVSEWAEKTGIKIRTIQWRIAAKRPIERILEA